METKQQITEIIQQSTLTDEQKEVWGEFLESLDQELLMPILETIKDDEEMLKLLTKNLEDKVAALAFNEPGAWDAIIEDEKQTLKSIDE
jgi:hypothetical protein